MSIGAQLLQESRYQELWERYCGFLDLTIEQFMAIQRRLLLEQLDLLNQCELGRHLFNGGCPTTVEEFRQEVPLTTYANYAPYLLDRREEALPATPVLWQRTSGASGEYPFKSAPVTERMYQEMGNVAFTILLLGTCRSRGEIAINGGEKMLYALAPPPYATGCWGRRAAEELPVHFLPDIRDAEDLSFEDRIAQGLRLGLDQGIDLIFGMPSVLVAIGEQLAQRSRKHSLRLLLAHPAALVRVLKGLVWSKIARRPLLPKDLWRLRGLATTGRDASLYRKRLEELWGRIPLDVYGSTEGFVIALQTWDYKAMTFLPHLNFLEFLPEEERLRTAMDQGYKPRTLLLSEVEEGGTYELIITNLLGGAFVRYRTGDLVTISSRRNAALGIDHPQMVFDSRCDGNIDLAGFARLTERSIGQAMEAANLRCRDWVAHKEGQESPTLHLYLELREPERRSADDLAEAIHQQLSRLDTPYAEIERYLGFKPVRVTVLPDGAFRQYAGRKRAEGADLAHLSPPRMNPSEAIIALLNLEPSVPVESPVESAAR